MHRPSVEVAVARRRHCCWPGCHCWPGCVAVAAATPDDTRKPRSGIPKRGACAARLVKLLIA